MVLLNAPFEPGQIGYQAERLQTLHEHFERLIERNIIQGASYCLARDGKVFAGGALGRLSYRKEDARPLTPDTLCDIASITKLFCATAVFKLVEDGRMRLDQKVGEFIEEFNVPPFKEIHIAHLLSHTSGMHAGPGCFENPYHISYWDFVNEGFTRGEKNWLKSALRGGMRTSPGTEWAYNSFGYAVLGEIVSRVSGVCVHDYITEQLLKPCGMASTGFDRSAPGIAQRYILRNAEQEKELQARMAGTYHPDETEALWSTVPDTAGGLFSNAEDLVKFGNMLLLGGKAGGSRVIGRKAIEKMTAVYTCDLKDYCWGAGGVQRVYGLGPDLRNNLASLYTKETYFHEGAGACCLMIDPTERMVAAWFVPFTGNWNGEALYNTAAVLWSGLE